MKRPKIKANKKSPKTASKPPNQHLCLQSAMVKGGWLFPLQLLLIFKLLFEVN